MTIISDKYVYGIEQRIFDVASFKIENNITTTDKIRDRAKSLFSEIDEDFKKSSYFSRLAYFLGMGAMGKKWALAKDLEVVANDLDRRPSTTVETLVSDFKDAAASGAINFLICKRLTPPSYYTGKYE